MSRFRDALSGIRGRLVGRTKVQASILYASSSLICQAMRFCGLIVSTRLIEKAQFGLFAQAVLALSFAGIVRDVGQNNALVSYSGGDRRYAAYNFQLNCLFGLIAAALLWAVLAIVPGIPVELRRAAPILAITTLLEILTQTGLVLAQKAFRFAMLARVEIGALAVWLATLVATVTRIEGCMVLLLALLAESVFRFAAIFAASGWRCVGRASGGDLRAYFFGKFARHCVPQTILQTISGRLDYLLLAFLGSVTQLGIYERMLQFIRIPWSLSINLIDRVLLVSYSREQADAVALRHTLRKSTRLIAGAVTGATLAATLGFALVLKPLVGADWAATILHHWWVALPLTLLTPFAWNLNIFFQGTGRVAQMLRNVAFSLVATAVAGACLVPRFGAAGMLAAQGCAFAALLWYQLKAVKTALAS